MMQARKLVYVKDTKMFVIGNKLCANNLYHFALHCGSSELLATEEDTEIQRSLYDIMSLTVMYVCVVEYL